MAEEQKPGYLIKFSKQTSMMGEIIQIDTNLPVGSTKDEIASELKKIAGAVDERMRALNAEVVAKTGKNLDDLGIKIPGVNAPEKGNPVQH